jgi:hypothetical protein
MKLNETVHFKPDSFNLISLVLKHWKSLLITGIVAAAISSFISLTIKPLFKSVVIVYPTTNVVETQTIFGTQRSSSVLFGDEKATEKVLQILRADNIKKYLIGKYDLMNHYGIGVDAKYQYTLLDARMNKYITSAKTQYNSIEISVLDADPVVASKIANDIARQIDTVFNQLVKEAGMKSFNAISNSYNDQFLRVKSLEDSILVLCPKGTTSVMPGSLKSGIANNSWAAASGLYSPEFLRLINMFETENENLSAIRSRLTETKILSEQDLPYIHMINEAKVAEKKTLPKRSLIVIASTLSTLLFMIFLLALSDSVVRDGK